MLQIKQCKATCNLAVASFKCFETSVRSLVLDVALIRLYQLNMKLHIILTPPNLPLPRGGAKGGGVFSMHLHMKMVLGIKLFWVLDFGLRRDTSTLRKAQCETLSRKILDRFDR